MYSAKRSEILTDWVYGPTSNNADDYYYKVDKRGRKIYYNRWRNKSNKVPRSLLIQKNVNITNIKEYSLTPTTIKESEESKSREKAYREKIKKDWEELLYGKFKSKNKTNTSKINYNHIGFSTLNRLGIRTKKEWKEWLLCNHPDKCTDANLELCATVIEEGKLKFVSM